MNAPLLFDRLMLRVRRRRGLRLGAETFLLDQVADEFAHRLRLVVRRFDLAVDLGTPTAAARRLRAAGDRRRSHHRALRDAAPAAAGPALHGGGKPAGRTPPCAAAPR